MKDLFAGKNVRIHWIWTWETMVIKVLAKSKARNVFSCFLYWWINKHSLWRIKLGFSMGDSFCWTLLSSHFSVAGIFTLTTFHRDLKYTPAREMEEVILFACSWRNPLLHTCHLLWHWHLVHESLSEALYILFPSLTGPCRYWVEVCTNEALDELFWWRRHSAPSF